MEFPQVLPNVRMHVGLDGRKERHATTSHQLMRRVFHETRDAMLVALGASVSDDTGPN